MPITLLPVIAKSEVIFLAADLAAAFCFAAALAFAALALPLAELALPLAAASPDAADAPALVESASSFEDDSELLLELPPVVKDFPP